MGICFEGILSQIMKYSIYCSTQNVKVAFKWDFRNESKNKCFKFTVQWTRHGWNRNQAEMNKIKSLSFSPGHHRTFTFTFSSFEVSVLIVCRLCRMSLLFEVQYICALVLYHKCKLTKHSCYFERAPSSLSFDHQEDLSKLCSVSLFVFTWKNGRGGVEERNTVVVWCVFPRVAIRMNNNLEGKAFILEFVMII